MQILSLKEIRTRIHLPKIIALQEEGFKAYSSGHVNVPPVGYIKMGHTPVSYHIKYGVMNGDDLFVIKLAGGLEQTTQEFGPSKIEGAMMVISAKNGKPLYLLQEEGYLTTLRTAVAGLISAKYLAPKNIIGMGVLGTGTQAREQVKILKEYTSCAEVYLWGRNGQHAQQYKQDMEEEGFNVHICDTPQKVAKRSNLIITTTCANSALLKVSDIQPGTHITAVGADSPGKQELDPELFSKADIIVADSRSQCLDHGEIGNSFVNGSLLELGEIIACPERGRTDEKQITIIDLTGIAVQDIQIAKAIVIQ